MPAPKPCPHDPLGCVECRRAKQRKYINQPEVRRRRLELQRAWYLEYYAKPENRERKRKRNREQQREYLTKPENRERKRKRNREYWTKPENRERKRKQHREYYINNRERILEKQSKYKTQPETRERNRKRRRESNSKWTPEQFQTAIQTQRGGCAICQISLIDGAELGHKQQLHADHDHVTGRPRGLLCGLCNVALGYARDSRALLLAAADYLHLHGTTDPLGQSILEKAARNNLNFLALLASR